MPTSGGLGDTGLTGSIKDLEGLDDINNEMDGVFENFKKEIDGIYIGGYAQKILDKLIGLSQLKSGIKGSDSINSPSGSNGIK